MNKKPVAKKPEPAKPVKTRVVAPVTAASILGFASPSADRSGSKKAGDEKVRPEWEKYRQRLIELRERLTAQMNGFLQTFRRAAASPQLELNKQAVDKRVKLSP